MSSEEKSKGRLIPITVALIGLLGVLIVAVVNNWDKIGSKPNQVDPHWYGSYSGERGYEHFAALIYGDGSSATLRMTAEYPEHEERAEDGHSVNVGDCNETWEGPVRPDGASLVYDVKWVSASSSLPGCNKHKHHDLVWGLITDHVSGLIFLEGDERHKSRVLHFQDNGSWLSNIVLRAERQLPPYVPEK